MRYFLSSIKTLSYWRYALFSFDGLTNLFAVVGVLYTAIDILDFFGIYTRDRYGRYALVFFLLAAIVAVLAARRPISRITYRPAKRDFTVEVKIGDLFTNPGEKIISSNTTFDTDVSTGLIAVGSVQGQFTQKYFAGRVNELDEQIQKSVANEAHFDAGRKPGKRQKYHMGTVARVNSYGENFYLLAMADMNEHGNAVTSVSNIDHALRELWRFMAERGELGDIVIPLLGSGRGRIELPRKKLVEKIAQSFVSASMGRVFSNRLIIVVHPSDAEKFAVNLFEVKDLLKQSIHS